MMMGLYTLFMTMSSKWKSEADDGDGADCHVFILSPFVVPVRVQFLTVRPTTSFSPGYFPKLPTLIPWPGPQNTSEMVTLTLPGPTDTQSSPVPMTEFVMRTSVESPMWMPSVFGLSPGALILIESSAKLLDEKMFMWKNLLSTEEMPLTVASVTKLNTKDYVQLQQLELSLYNYIFSG